MLRPIGGWRGYTNGTVPLDQVLTDTANQRSRALHSWRLNDGTFICVVGHNQGLKALNNATATVYDITPAGFVNQPIGTPESAGYGLGPYGVDTYGTPRAVNTDNVAIFNWCFRNYGQNLLAGGRGFSSSLYEWDTTLLSPAAVVPNAPTDFDCFHVTEQRIVMTAGSATDPRLIQWSDSEDLTTWTPDLTNQAGFQRLSGNGKFVEIVSFKDQYVLIGQTDIQVCQYISPPYIFGFDKLGEDVGCFSGAAVVATNDFIVWPSNRNFMLYDGQLRTLECEVIDEVAALLDGPNRGKTIGYVNPQWSEVWWLFQSEGSETKEVDSYVVWDYQENHWQTGTLDRTCGGGLPVNSGILMMGADGYLYQHELPDVLPAVNASEVFAETGPIQIGNGDGTQYISAYVPDFELTGSVNLTLIGQDRPSGPETTFGPYNIPYPAATNQPVPTRARGNTVRMRITGEQSTWSHGAGRLEIVGGGKK
jgi:hypothetical protein